VRPSPAARRGVRYGQATVAWANDIGWPGAVAAARLRAGTSKDRVLMLPTEVKLPTCLNTQGNNNTTVYTKA
jgi:hypothetical protein